MSEQTQMNYPAPIALITGAGKRIGRQLALHLAKEGWDIIAHYNHSEDEAKSLINEVEKLGQQGTPLKADLSDSKAVAEMMSRAVTKLGCPHLLINNASLFEEDQFGELEASTFDIHMAINLRAPLILADHLATHIKKTTIRSERAVGHVINFTDQRVFNPGTDFVSYTMSKIGLSEATPIMAKALAPTIRVNAIAPGPVLKSKHQTEEEFQQEAEGTPLGFGAKPEEICAAVDFILSANSMTGETITLDGGQRLQSR